MSDTIPDEMRALALRIEILSDPPTISDLAGKMEEWAAELDDRGLCGNCSELQATVEELERDLCDAVGDFADFDNWKHQRQRIAELEAELAGRCPDCYEIDALRAEVARLRGLLERAAEALSWRRAHPLLCKEIRAALAEEDGR